MDVFEFSKDGTTRGVIPMVVIAIN